MRESVWQRRERIESLQGWGLILGSLAGLVGLVGWIYVLRAAGVPW